MMIDNTLYWLMMKTPSGNRILAVLLLATALIGASVGAQPASPRPQAAQQAQSSTAPSRASTGPTTTTTALPTGGNAAVIRIDGLIYGFTLKSLQERVDRAISSGASLIVIELDTRGGLVDTALKIGKTIKSMNAPTVAWINPEAYSAGIMIAAACDRIVMSPASATGDCAPITPGMNLSPTERAKALSPILEEFRDSARMNGHDFVLFQAMCVLGVEVYQIEHRHTGERRLVNQADYAVMVEATPANDTPPTQDVATTQPIAVVGGARVTVAAEADRGQWVVVQKVHDGTTLLTLSQQRALDLGLAQAIVRDTFELQQFLGAATLTTIPASQTAMVAYWLTQPWVRAILMIAMLIGAYMELQAPGLGAGGIVAITSLLLLMVAPFLVGLAQAWHVVLFLLGLLLLLAEIFVTPGFGLLGVGGVVCMFVGLVLMAVPTTGRGPMPMPAPEVAQRLRESVLYTLVAIIASGVGFYYLTKYFGAIPVLNRLILRNPIPPRPASSRRRAKGHRPAHHDSGDGEPMVQVGTTGHTFTQLRPIGQAEFDGRIMDVITHGEWLDQGQTIRVVEVHGNRILVEPHETD